MDGPMNAEHRTARVKRAAVLAGGALAFAAGAALALAACRAGGAPEPLAEGAASGPGAAREAAEPRAAQPERPPAGGAPNAERRPDVGEEERSALRGATTTRDGEVRRLRAPKHLPEPARDLLWERMQGHGTDMTLLLWAVLFLDYEGAAELSRAILSEPRFSRPIGPEDPTLNSLLPEEFFQLQDELAVRAKKMAEVAGAVRRDGAALAKAYGELAEICVRCHATYLEDRPPPDGTRAD